MLNENEVNTEFVNFWNDVLVPKFIKYKHILVDGLTHHSETIFPTLEVKQGDSVLDTDCGFGDTALKFAERVGPTGRVVGLDCCEAFMEYGYKEVAMPSTSNSPPVRQGKCSMKPVKKPNRSTPKLKKPCRRPLLFTTQPPKASSWNYHYG